ncbi:MAG: DUF3237 family protein [Hyphomonadaceae bacterium]|nr:DUF3237 family protein [Hyphomonadaceae bacterium]
MTTDASRRGLLTAAAAAPAAAIVANAAQAEEAALRIAFVFEAVVTLGPAEEIGQTPYGRRVRIPITGGAFSGPRIRGLVVPGAMDWQLVRPDGYTMIEASYMLRADDGALIHIQNKGLLGKGYVRTTPVFEAPNGPHAWLNEAVFTGTIGAPPEGSGPAVRIMIHKIL